MTKDQINKMKVGRLSADLQRAIEREAELKCSLNLALEGWCLSIEKLEAEAALVKVKAALRTFGVPLGILAG